MAGWLSWASADAYYLPKPNANGQADEQMRPVLDNTRVRSSPSRVLQEGLLLSFERSSRMARSHWRSA